jgi:hypothetical protein
LIQLWGQRFFLIDPSTWLAQDRVVGNQRTPARTLPRILEEGALL